MVKSAAKRGTQAYLARYPRKLSFLSAQICVLHHDLGAHHDAWFQIFCAGPCPLLAQSGHHDRADLGPVSGVKRTFLQRASMSVIDPRRTGVTLCPIRAVFLDQGVVPGGEAAISFISDLTILHADDGSPHADCIFRTYVIVASGCACFALSAAMSASSASWREPILFVLHLG